MDDKTGYLVRALLQKASCLEDLEPNLESVSYPRLPFPDISKREIYNSVIKIKNSTSDKDGMTTLILRKKWPVLGSAISTLYQHCLNQGWHPTPFQDVLLVGIPKPEKRDWSSPRAYRLITLLSVLRKGLERLVARQMVWIAIKFKVLHSQQFGALSLRSITDLTAALVHDIEKTWARGLKASMLILNIQGAFDAVLPDCLIEQLQK